MYFDDLTKYSYYQRSAFENVFNVGWLDDKHEYSVGEVDSEFLSNLRESKSATKIVATQTAESLNNSAQICCTPGKNHTRKCSERRLAP